MILFSDLSKRHGATLAGIFGLALSSVVLLCGAGSVPVENFLPQGAMQGDLNAGGHNLTNAATVSATNVIVTGTFTAPASFTLPFSQITSPPTLGSLATLSPSGTADSSHYLRGDDTWAGFGSGVATALGHAVDASGGVLTFGGLGTVTQAHSGNLDAVATGAAANPGYVLTANGDGTVSYQSSAGGSSLTLGTNFSTVAGITSGTLELLNAPNGPNGLATLDAEGDIDYPGSGDPIAGVSLLNYPDGNEFCDSFGSIYYDSGAYLTDGANLYFPGSGTGVLGDSEGNVHGNGSNLTGLTWSQLGGTPTTLTGYGITDSASHVSPPAHSTDAGTLGQWSIDSTYLYFYTGAAWGRIALTTSF